jgi:hypothetical protein
MYLANWHLVTRPKQLEGLGVPDIANMNKSLMMKWMWNYVNDTSVWWAIHSNQEHIKPWEHANMSKFWKDIGALTPIFNVSVKYQLG